MTEPTKLAFITIGAPAAGKSTWAETLQGTHEGDWNIVERDLIRRELCIVEHLLPGFDYRNGNFQEAYYSLDKGIINNVEKLVNIQINEYISYDDNLIFSNTNLSVKSRNTLIKNLENNGYYVELVIFNPTLKDLLERNIKRTDVVNDSVIFNMYQRMQHQLKDLIKGGATIIETHNTNTDWHKECVIVDLDGTVAHVKNNEFGKPERTHFDMSKVDQDEFDYIVFSMVRGVINETEARLVFLTGRGAGCFKKTVQWLNRHLARYGMSYEDGDFEIYSRLSGDYRKDFIIKQELYETFIKDKYNVIAVFDDRPQVVNLWNDLGLKTIAVADQRIVF